MFTVPLKKKSIPSLDIETVNVDQITILNEWHAWSAPNVGLWWFRFGEHGGIHVFVWAGDAVEREEYAFAASAAWLKKHSPEIFVSKKEQLKLLEAELKSRGKTCRDYHTEAPEMWTDEVELAAFEDLTDTEYGYLRVAEEWSDELDSDDAIYRQVWEETVDQLGEGGELTDDDIEVVNKAAKEMGVAARWELDEVTY